MSYSRSNKAIDTDASKGARSLRDLLPLVAGYTHVEAVQELP